MLLRSRILALLLGLGFVWLMTGPVAADKDDAAQIDKLIEQLGSGSYQEREAATKALDLIGIPALEKLRQATQSDDAEIKRRATDLVKRIEKRAEVSRVLTPKRVHLVYKDTPLKEALEDFKKKSGYDLVLQDPENKLADRKVTLDTGETTFWEALDQLCDKAGIVQVTQQEMMQQMMQDMMMKQRGMMEQMKKARPPAQPAKDAAPKDKEPPASPAPKANEKPKNEPKQDPPAKPVEKQAAAAEKERAVQIQAVRAQMEAVLQVQAAVARQGVMTGPAGGGYPVGSPNQIVLTGGKRKPLPTHYAGTVRIRATEPNQQPAGQDAPLFLNLQVATEPKFQLRGVTAASIKKAVDDQGQSLTQLTPGEDAVGPAIGIAPPRRAIVRMEMPYSMGGPGTTTIPLKRGEKPSKTIKELTCTLTLQILDVAEHLITVDNVLKAGGTTTKGKAGGQIKVVEATKTEEGQIKLKVELDLPPDAVPAGSQGFGGAAWTTPAIRVKLAAPVAPPAAAPPPPAPAEKPKEEKPKDDKGRADKPKDEKPQAKEQVKEKPLPAPPVAVRAVAGAALNLGARGHHAGDAFNGLSLVDDKGKTIPLVGVGVTASAVVGGQLMQTYELTFELKKDQAEPAKLIFSGSKVVMVEVPFTLKDVPLQ
jgi:hypothetical protein